MAVSRAVALRGPAGWLYLPPFGADHKASIMLAALMQNKVICTPADHLPATGRAA